MKSNGKDDGFGLTEIMVSMLLLAIVMMAILSLLITAITAVGESSTRASATELATQRMEVARAKAATGDCDNVRDAVEATETVVDGRGVPLEITGTLTNCVQTGPDPKLEPKLALVTVVVTPQVADLEVADITLTSNIYVKFDA
ncbi:type IV pilus modification PilV family protein [Demequina activiva]|nr:hypothetical protein [Demequina activiva]